MTAIPALSADPVQLAGELSALTARQTAVQAQVSVLRSALDLEAAAAEQLFAAMGIGTQVDISA